jgi:hypothetical protein
MNWKATVSSETGKLVFTHGITGEVREDNPLLRQVQLQSVPMLQRQDSSRRRSREANLKQTPGGRDMIWLTFNRLTSLHKNWFDEKKQLFVKIADKLPYRLPPAQIAACGQLEPSICASIVELFRILSSPGFTGEMAPVMQTMQSLKKSFLVYTGILTATCNDLPQQYLSLIKRAEAKIGKLDSPCKAAEHPLNDAVNVHKARLVGDQITDKIRSVGSRVRCLVVLHLVESLRYLRKRARLCTREVDTFSFDAASR